MTSPEMTLLQFVALTLPAVAILLQAILRYRDKYLDQSSATSYETEFFLLEIGFWALIAGGMLFAFEIFKDVNSSFTKLGIIAVSISLILIGFSTLLALRRPKYISEEKSLEEELKNRGVRYGIIIAVIVGTATIGVTLSNIIRIRFSDGASLLMVSAYLLLSFLIGWLGSLSLEYYGFQKGREEVNSWKKEKEAVATRTLEVAKRLQDASGGSDNVFPHRQQLKN